MKGVVNVDWPRFNTPEHNTVNKGGRAGTV